VQTNELGLLDEFQAASEWAGVIMHEQRAEPGLWLPWLLVDYTAQMAGDSGHAGDLP
jgi:hypothetical protein